ncbi:unnamed protein product [Macrosiphum euphorbiae]|uniref:Uncharacterized protein n=1 Tax=Macrosiphum euphorbiae TaxID=13131 RepID=A0AAV0XCW0_9HEMI|nr:unnamed protein product [Macrosiphum euphorbiae]
MRASYIYVLLLSALISSETADLEKILSRLVSSSFELVAKPITKLLENEVPPDMKANVETFLNEFSHKLKRLMEQTQEELFNQIPKPQRENTKKAIGYLSMYMSGALSNAMRVVTKVTNKSFDELPDNIKTKLLDIGNDIDDFLKKIKVDLSDTKTSQKTSEQ